MAYVEVSLDGLCAMVDAEDVTRIDEELWSFHKNAVHSSPRFGRPGTQLHRVVLGLTPADRVRVDHRNGDTLDNRKANLRVADAAQNGWNRTRANRNNTSGAAGVARNRANWMAYLDVRGKRIHLGTYSTVVAAAAARRAGEREYFGEWAPSYGATNQKSPRRGVTGGDAPIV